MTEYTTNSGIRLRIGKLSRRKLDSFAQAYPLPEVPTKEVKIIGGVIEQVSDPDNPEYKKELVAYYINFAHERFSLLEPQIEILEKWKENKKLRLMIDASIATKTKRDYLLFVALDDNDLEKIVEEIYYKSTVTERGIQEAKKQYNVTWMKQDIESWRVKKAPGKYGQIFEHREAARFCNMSWKKFCKLDGPEQSMIVAHYRIKNRLDALVNQMDKR